MKRKTVTSIVALATVNQPNQADRSPFERR